jgi:hypothetical protein
MSIFALLTDVSDQELKTLKKSEIILNQFKIDYHTKPLKSISDYRFFYDNREQIKKALNEIIDVQNDEIKSRSFDEKLNSYIDFANSMFSNRFANKPLLSFTIDMINIYRRVQKSLQSLITI